MIVMSIKDVLRSLKNGYVVRQVNQIPLPAFEPSPEVLKLIVFQGRVQNVGFRLEVFELAKKLGLVGWVKNRQDGAVEALIQGEQNKIRFLIHFMESLKRAKVTNTVVTTVMEPCDAKDFSIHPDSC
jgi:acylphosphatase